jgi:ABC-type glycerol-3-phosphate transport system substrate-binding protein
VYLNSNNYTKGEKQMKTTTIAALAVLIVLSLVTTAGFAQENASTTVMVGGTGENLHLQTVLDGIADMLSDNDIDVKVVSGEAKARRLILEEMKEMGATNLLYVTVTSAPGSRGRLTVQCFIDGKQVWEDEVRGSLVATSADGEIKGMLKNINTKLKNRIGKPGLPKP